MLLKEHLRLFGVFNNTMQQIVFSAVRWSDCQRYIRMMKHQSIDDFEILRFDVNKDYVDKQTTNKGVKSC